MPKINYKSKKNKLFFKNSFNLANKKVRFFVVIGVFVILGGGYFTYKSFAATTQYASMANYQLKGINAVGFFEQSKNNLQVLRVQPQGGSAYATFDVPVNTNIKYCYTARADRPIGVWFLAIPTDSANFSGKGGLPPANSILSTSYTTFCQTIRSENIKLRVQLSSITDGLLNPGASMYVSQLSVEILAPAAPTPAK